MSRQSPVPTGPPTPLGALLHAVQSGTYRPGPLWRRSRAKPDGGVRVLGIPPLADRVVQLALLDLVTTLADARLSPNVHGYRRGRSPQTAIRQLLSARAPVLGVVQADITEMFDSLPHALVRQAALGAIPGDRWAWLLDRWLAAWATAPGVGLPQGAPLSPLLANLTLSLALDQHLDGATPRGARAPPSAAGRLSAARATIHAALAGRGVAAPWPTSRASAPAVSPRLLTWVRYGDDLVLLCDEPDGAPRALGWLDGLARAARLRLSSKKTACSAAREGQPLPRPVLGVSLRFTRSRGRWGLCPAEAAWSPAPPDPLWSL